MKSYVPWIINLSKIKSTIKKVSTDRASMILISDVPFSLTSHSSIEFPGVQSKVVRGIGNTEVVVRGPQRGAVCGCHVHF